MIARARVVVLSPAVLVLAMACTPRPVPAPDAGLNDGEPDAGAIVDGGTALSALGERCDADGECASGICVLADLAGLPRVCVAACAEGGDCSELGSGYLCVDNTTESGVQPICRRSCDGGCAASEVCTVSSTDDGELRFCAESGPPCSSQGDCDGVACAPVES